MAREPKAVSDRTVGALLVILGCLFLASNGIVASVAMDGGLDPSTVAAVRTYGGALLLLPFVVRARHLYTRPMLLPIVAYALLGLFASQGLYFEAIARMDVALALVIAYLAPLPVALYQRVRVGERLPGYAYGAMGAAVAGIALAVIGGSGVGEVTPLGLALAVACMLTFAIMLIFGAKQPRGFDPFARAGAPMLVAALAWFAIVPAWEVPWGLMAETVPLAGAPTVGIPLWSTLVWAIAVGAVLSFTTILAGTVRVGAGAASMLSMAEPVFVAFGAWAVLGQALTPVQSLGIATAVVAVGVVEHARVRCIAVVEVADPLAPLADGDPR
jgi:drug/metabolite transporter (DMT)-like permease